MKLIINFSLYIKFLFMKFIIFKNFKLYNNDPIFWIKNLFNKLLFNSIITPKNIYIKKYLKENNPNGTK